MALEKSEVKKLLKIPDADTSQDDFIEAMIPIATEFAESHCNRSFANDMPFGVKLGVAKLIESFGSNNNVSSESIGDLSQSFFSSDIPDSVKTFLKPYRQVKFV